MNSLKIKVNEEGRVIPLFKKIKLYESIDEILEKRKPGRRKDIFNQTLGNLMDELSADTVDLIKDYKFDLDYYG